MMTLQKLCLATLAGVAVAMANPTVLIDEPYRLVVKIDAALPQVVHHGEDGISLHIPSYGNWSESGYPNTPVWRFQVVSSGETLPQAQIQILETELLPNQAGIAPVKTWSTPQQSFSRRNPEAYAQNQSQKIIWEKPGYYRGTPLISGALPLVWLDASGKPIGYIRSAKVVLTWPKGLQRGRSLPKPLAEQVINPAGGAYLWAPPKAALARRSASPTPSPNLIRIRIGDRVLDQFEEDGYYALPYTALVAKSLAIPGVKWADIRLYTGPNDTLSTRMDTLPLEPSALREVPFEMVDNGNGVFDEADSIKFFAHGTSVWKRVSDSAHPIQYLFGTDPYSFDNFYYLDLPKDGSSAATAPARLATRAAAAAPNPRPSGLSYLRAERDVGTAFCDPSSKLDEEPGYEWHWHWRSDDCKETRLKPATLLKADLARPHLDTLPGYVGDTVYLGMSEFRGFNDDVFEISIPSASQALPYLGWTGIAGSWYAIPGDLPGARFQIDKMIWTGGRRRFEGYTVAYRRQYEFNGKPFWIFPAEVGKTQAYRITGNPNFRILKVVDGLGVDIILPAADGSFSDSLPKASDGRYFIFAAAKTLSSEDLQAHTAPAEGMAMRNLTTGDGILPENLIITGEDLLPAALEYRDYRSDDKRILPLKTAVVRIEDIYRQFSGGRKTPVAIRDFLRWALFHWDPQGRAHNPLRFITLLGDGHYDLRNIKTDAKSTTFPNIIPAYEDFSSEADALCTDDFFVKLDFEDQGFFAEGVSHGLLDVAIGRIPVRSVQEAREYLQKVKDYEDPQQGGFWRSRVVLTADDVTQLGQADDLDKIRNHTSDTEILGGIIQANDPGMQLDKVYLLDYSLNSAGRKPEAAQDLIDFINRGALAVNFVGHGAYNQWADEALIFTRDAIPKLNNQGKVTMINSFSCTVGRFDILQNDVLTEQFVREKNVGAIAGISATRESYPGPNLNLAWAVYGAMIPSDSVERLIPIGLALQEVKNKISFNSFQANNDSKYVLLGDPAILLRRPKLSVALQKYPDTLSALDCGQISGTVAGGGGKGFAHLQVLSGSVRKDYSGPGLEGQGQYQDKRGSILYERTIPYVDGRFTTDYFIPKKIPYGDTTAKIQVYAWDIDKAAEGSMAVTNLSIQGTAVNSACADDRDKKGPAIKITGCDKVETGGVDMPEAIKVTLPYCFSIEVEDSTGGVVSGEGPDEGTTLEIPGFVDPFHPQPGVDNLYSKSYRYPLGKNDLNPGQYLLKVAAHDGYGNANSRSLRLQVVADTIATSVAAFNIPNPMKNNGTRFYFSTVIPADDGEYLPVPKTIRMKYDLKIFNQRGRLVKIILSENANGQFWDGHDDFGNRLANGIYTYKVSATYDPGDGTGKKYVSTKRNTLVISR